MSDTPESDRLGSFLHPRENEHLFGHEEAERDLLARLASGKMPHALILSGPRGIGKATLAWRLARFLFAGGEQLAPHAKSLQVDSTNEVFRRVASGGHADMLSLRRPWDDKTKKFRRDLTVEEMRRIGPFFGKKSAEGGWRIAVVDAADDMNIPAANAILKILEEPPDRALIILVAHSPGRLLPTIRSRCQILPLQPLDPADLEKAIRRVQAGDPLALTSEEIAAVAALAEGSVGRALELAGAGGFDYYLALCEILFGLPALDIRKLDALAGQFAGAKGAEAWPVFRDLFLDLLARIARAGATGGSGPEVVEGEGAALANLGTRLGPTRVIDLREEARHLFERTDAVNLDRRHAIMSTVYRIEAALKTAA